MKLSIHPPIARLSAIAGIVAVCIWAPVAGHAQLEGPVAAVSVEQEFRDVGILPVSAPTSAFGDGYLLRTMALGVPSTMLSVANLRGGHAGGLWTGLAGIGLGVGHGALFVAGVREEEKPTEATLWWNAIASAYSTVSGILQIRSTFGEGSDSSSFRASLTPEIDGVRFRATWKH